MTRRKKAGSQAQGKRKPSAKSKPAKPMSWQDKRRAEGTPEAFIRLEQHMRDSGFTVVDAEPPTDMDRFEVNFVPRRAARPSPPPTESRGGSDDAHADAHADADADADGDGDGAKPRGGR